MSIKKKKHFCCRVLLAKLKKRKVMFICILILLVFPLIIGFIASLNLPNIINVDTGDLLSYYGVVFGIFASFITYYETKQNEKKERLKEIKPLIVIKTIEWESNLLKIEIINVSDNLLNDFFLFDKYLSASLSHNKSIKDCIAISDNDIYSNNALLAANDNIVKKNEFNKKNYIDYIQICCEDIDGNMWDCRFTPIIEGKTINYIMSDCEVV